MKINEFVVGEIYERPNELNIYKCVEATDDWVLMLDYSFNHHVASCEFWNQYYLDQDFNQCLRLVNECDEKYYKSVFVENLEVHSRDNTMLCYKG